jgi:hypothetical protein
MYIVWTEQEITFIKQHAYIISDEQAAAILSKNSGRKISVDTYRKKRQSLGIKKGHGRGKFGCS